MSASPTLFQKIKLHWRSAMILRNNPTLLHMYNLGAETLYTLDRQQYPNKTVQDDYNKLHRDYKYHVVLDKGAPFSILIADPKFIRHLRFNVARFD